MVLIMHICFRTDDDDDDTMIIIVAAVVAAVVFAAAVLVAVVVIGLVVQRKKKRKSGHGKERDRQWLSQIILRCTVKHIFMIILGSLEAMKQNVCSSICSNNLLATFHLQYWLLC